MNLSHVAALVLAGWYLMYPPMTPDGKNLTDAPLAKWGTAACFDTAKECEAARIHGQRSAKDLSGRFAVFKERFDLARCVATDDPRLNGN